MENKGRAIAAAIIGLIVIAVTFIIFFTAISKWETIHLVSLLFIILTELIVVCGFIAVDNYAQHSSGVMLRSGAFSLLFLYFIATVIVSIMFLTGFGSSIKWLVALQLVIMAITAIIMVLLIANSKSLYEKNRTLLQSAAILKQLEDLVLLLKSNVKNDKYARQLEKVFEAIRYCDNSAYVSSDDLIAVKINVLEEILRTDSESKDEKVGSVTDEILLLIKKRAAEVSVLKAGSI